MASVYQYRFTCGLTGATGPPQVHYVWDIQEPTTCPENDPNHILNTNSITVVNTVEETTVKVKEEDIPTGGRLQVTSRNSMITGFTGSPQIFDYTLPININLASVQVPLGNEHTGDIFEACVAPNTTIGLLATDGATGATEINVTSTVIDNISTGFFVTLTDGVNVHDGGYVTAIDKVNETITMEHALEESFSALSPTYVQMTIKLADQVYLGPPVILHFGGDKIGTSYIPANTTVRLTYWNKTGGEKNLIIYAEYLY